MLISQCTVQVTLTLHLECYYSQEAKANISASKVCSRVPVYHTGTLKCNNRKYLKRVSSLILQCLKVTVIWVLM